LIESGIEKAKWHLAYVDAGTYGDIRRTAEWLRAKLLKKIR